MTPTPASTRGSFATLIRSPTHSAAQLSVLLAQVQAINNSVTLEFADLKNYCDTLEKDVIASRRTRERQCKDLRSTNQQCQALRASVHWLDAELTHSEDCVRVAVRGLALIKQQLVTRECSYGALKDEFAALYLSIKNKDVHATKLNTDLVASKAAYDQLAREHEQHVAANTQVVNDLQAEADTLASQLAVANAKADQKSNVVRVLQSRLQTLSKLHIEEQQQSKCPKAQVDAIYVRQQRDSQHFTAQLQAKDAANKALQDQLQQSEAGATKLVFSRDNQIVALQDQLRRLTLERDSEQALAEAWAHYANSK